MISCDRRHWSSGPCRRISWNGWSTSSSAIWSIPNGARQRLPLIPEVLILHHADDLDAKLEMYLRCLSRDQSPGPFTLRDPVLGKPLLKPGAWTEHR